MKRSQRIALGLLAVGAIAAAGAAVARPDLLRALARLRLPDRGNAGHSADSGLFCREHGVPEKFCTLCHPQLKETLLLCREHGDIPEDICTLCHPEAAGKHNLKDLCPHGLPRHFCKQCAGGGQTSGAVDDGWCAAHNQPEETCAECQGGPPPSAGAAAAVCRQPLPLVRFASAELAEIIGLETVQAPQETHAHFLKANAETAYDGNHYAEISPRVAGFLREVKADLGQAVQPGEVLAVVDSAEVSAAKSQYLSAQAALRLAEANYKRIKTLVERNAATPAQELDLEAAFQQAQAAFQDAAQKLRNWGFTDAQLVQVLNTKDTGSELPVVSPIGGTVVLRHAVRGEAVQPTSQLFAVADMASVWLWIDVYESDIASIAVGQPVRFVISGTEGPAFPGKVTWVGTEVNPTTRTTRLRAELPNSQGRLRANQFGQAEIQVGPEHGVVVVPREAVQRKDRADVVFIPVGEGRYRPQRVVTKPSDREDAVEIVWGLKAGETVVTTGAFLLKTEITQGAIGAGCCE
jgi:cobalt-zinc-cadmium efflux system membrane fusion protein